METRTLTAREFHTVLSMHNVAPSADFVAKAGSDYGYVAAWELEHGYLIQYGNNGQTDWVFADYADDLAAWLESPDLTTLETIVQTANVRGEGAVDEADEGAAGPFYILKTQSWYGPTKSSGLVMDDECRAPLSFSSHADAQDWIDSAETETYVLEHNESGSPGYKIVSE